MNDLHETLKQARERKGGVETTRLNLKELEKKFVQHHETHGYALEEIQSVFEEFREARGFVIVYAGKTWDEFFELVSQLKYDGHLFKYDPRDGKWYAESVKGLGPWEEVNLNEYFFFMGQQTTE